MAQKEINQIVFIDKKSNVLAYCPTCEVVVFNGSDKTATENMVLRDRVADHNEWHLVDVVYPKIGKGKIVDGDSFLSMTQFPDDVLRKGSV